MYFASPAGCRRPLWKSAGRRRACRVSEDAGHAGPWQRRGLRALRSEVFQFLSSGSFYRPGLWCHGM